MTCLCINEAKRLDIFTVLGLPFFAVVGYTKHRSRSMSFTFSMCTSTGLSPVSLLSVSLVANVFPDSAIIMFIFSSVDILIGLGRLNLNFGLVYGMFLYLQYLEYI